VGTVSRDLLRATSCPVLVVPESAHVRPANPATRTDPVVVGLADDPLSGPVLRAAADEATVRRASVEVLHCYAAAHGESDERARARAAARAGELVAAIRGEDERWSTIPHSVVVTNEPAAQALCRRSTAASVIVLGTRGPGALAGLSLTSVSRAVVASARGPVLLVVPGTGWSTSPSGEADRITT
jgi:nucleotide-binding universal stress UspA family protein